MPDYEALHRFPNPARKWFEFWKPKYLWVADKDLKKIGRQVDSLHGFERVGDVAKQSLHTKNGYEIVDRERAIKCLDCNMVSYNINDIEYKYCGNCHKFHQPK